VNAAKKKSPVKKEPTKRAGLTRELELIEELNRDNNDSPAQLLGSNALQIKIRGVISTQCPAIDNAIGRGGIPLGRLTIVHGKESCLVGETKVRINRANKGFVCRLDHVVKMFSGGTASGKRWDSKIATYIRVCKDVDRGGLGKLTGAWCAGTRDVFRVALESGHSVVATAEHRFLTQDGWKRLKSLSLADKVFVEVDSHPSKKIHEAKPRRTICRIPTHPYANGKRSGRYGVALHRLVMEAELNGLAVDEFISLVRANKIDGLFFLDPKVWVVHHIDKDGSNNNIGNLMLLTKREHKEEHYSDSVYNLSTGLTKVGVESIDKVGKRAVYDLETSEENYLANGVVVHNSGKTTLALHCAAETQRREGICVYADAEYKLDPDYARGIGVDLDHLILVQPKCLEDFFRLIERTIGVAVRHREKGNNFPVLIILDSINSLGTKAEMDADWDDVTVAQAARFYSDKLKKLMPLVSHEDIALLFISQERERINVMYGKKEQTGGGRALRYHSSLMMEITRIGSVKDGEMDIGNETRVVCRKNQIAPPFRQAEFRVIYGKGFDYNDSLACEAARLGKLEKVGNWYKFQGNSVGQGLQAVTEKISKDEVLRDLLKEVVLNDWAKASATTP
jgi:recombination protein RecA